jgi:hypothetical protein
MAASFGVGRAASQLENPCAVRPSTNVQQSVAVQVNEPVASNVGCSIVRDRNECSSSPRVLQAPRRDKSSTGGGRGRAPPPWQCASPPRNGGYVGNRLAGLADPATDLGSGPLGQRPPEERSPHLLGPRRHRTVPIRAAPKTLDPHQYHRPVRHRQIPPSPLPAMPDRSSAAPLAPDLRRGRLHRQPPRTIDVDLGANHEPAQPQGRGRAVATVDHRQGPPVLQLLASREIARALAALVDPYRTPTLMTRPTLHRVELRTPTTPASSSGASTVPPRREDAHGSHPPGADGYIPSPARRARVATTEGACSSALSAIDSVHPGRALRRGHPQGA